jgi:hypothetical protein
MNVHPAPETVTGFQQGTLDPHAALIVDAHLNGCDACRGRFSVPADAAEESWLQIRAVIRLPVPGLAERLLMRAGLSPALARMLTDTPVFHGGWLIAVALTLAFAGWAASSAGDGQHLLPFLLAAPLVPLLGVAVNLSRPSDPIAQIAAVTPTDGLLLVLMRTLATSVVGLCIAALVDVVAIPPDRSWLWVLPSLSVTALALAAGTILPRPHAVGLVGSLWALGIVVIGFTDQPLAAIQQTTSSWAIAGAAGVAVLLARRNSYRQQDE